MTGGCGYLHPGDITHHFFSGNKVFDPAELATIWEDKYGLSAWTLIGPGHRSFDAQVRPDLRGGEFEQSVLEYAESRTRELMARHGIDGDRTEAGACRCDSDRSRLLLELGWIPGTKAEYVLNRRSLRAIPEAVAELLSSIFRRSEWTEELYRRYMQSPGYSAEREFVAEAADRSLAAFTVTWHSQFNGTALFEPVGTHPDHRRRGLGRALLHTGMHRMADHGLVHALVQSEGSNEASRRLYQSCGFEPWQAEDNYFKMIA